MKLNRKTVLEVVCASLCLVSVSASALTLGKLRGAAILGKELDVTVAVQYAADEDISQTCFDADVQFGDIPVDGNRVTVKSVAGSQPQTQLVRISTSARIEDAVVTIHLKTTCGSKASRRYVLLSEVLSESAAPSLASTVAEVSAGKVDSGSGTAKLKLEAPVPKDAAPAQPSTKGSPATAKQAKAVAGNTAKKPAPAPGTEHAAGVKAANAANALILEDLQRRVDGIEQWQAQSSTADELLKSKERNQLLETGLNGLKLVTAKNQQSLQQISTALEGVESDSYGRSLAYALGALLALCAGALGYVVKRTRSGSESSAWWHGGEARPNLQKAEAKNAEDALASVHDTSTGTAQQDSVAPHSVTTAVMAAQPARAGSAPVDVDFDIDLASGMDVSSAPAALTETVASPSLGSSATGDTGTGKVATGRAINTREMLDIRQQAEFYIALGQHEDAVRLLEASISESSEANPLVYLDLLKIFHTLSRREDFERVRVEFNQFFTGRVLSYADFLDEGNGLDAYEEICQQIVVLWPTEYAVDFIEQCLVRTPEDDPEQGIDLEAFKDLLLLYGILKRLGQPSDSSMVPFSTSRLSHTQMDAVQQGKSIAESSQEDGTALPLPTVSSAAEDSSLSVDLDLDLGGNVPAEKEPAGGNLIDFDMSGFVKPESDKPGSK